MIDKIPCPACGLTQLANTDKMNDTKITHLPAGIIAEGQTMAGITEKKMSIVKCEKCSFIGIYIENRAAFIIEPK
jgi:hypothetical protein